MFSGDLRYVITQAQARKFKGGNLVGCHAESEIPQARQADQIRRHDAEADARPAAAKRKKSEAKSLEKETALKRRLF